MDESQQYESLTRERIRDIFTLHRGEAKKMAEKLGKSGTVISHVLNGKATSRGVLEALRQRALEILEADKQKGRAA